MTSAGDAADSAEAGCLAPKSAEDDWKGSVSRKFPEGVARWWLHIILGWRIKPDAKKDFKDVLRW